MLSASPARWLADVGVIGTLLVWHVIGAISSDDGYNLTIARVSGDAGYTANYYRYFGATRGTVRLVSVGAGPARPGQHGGSLDADPRVGGGRLQLVDPQPPGAPETRARRSWAGSDRIAIWTAGAVFLAAGCLSTTGCGPEPLIAFGVLATWMLMETALGTRRLVPPRQP